jgi:hypothetical protein
MKHLFSSRGIDTNSGSGRWSQSLFVFFGAAFCFMNEDNRQTSSEKVPVLRYTLLSTSLVRLEAGYLLNSGSFQAISTQTNTLAFFELPMIEAVSGKVVMPLIDYSLYQPYISNWVRSNQTYSIDLSPFVVVCVQGTCDPNAGPNLLLPNLVLENVPPYSTPVVINWSDQGATIYDDQNILVSFYVVNGGGSDVPNAFSTAAYVDDQFVGEVRLNGLMVGSNLGLELDGVKAGTLAPRMKGSVPRLFNPGAVDPAVPFRKFAS